MRGRRWFIGLMGGGALALTAPARAQTAARRIAVLGPAEEPRFSQVVDGLRRGLREHGHADAALAVLEYRVTRGDGAAAAAAVARAIERGVAVLFVIGSELVRVARRVSADLPIVFITPGDPVAAGLVASLARPGGNTTAMTFEYPELSGKRLELLKTIAPGARRVLVLHDPADASPRQGLAAARRASAQLGLTLLDAPLRAAADVARVVEALGAADALLAIPGGGTPAHYREIVAAANARRLPTFFHARTGATSEALATYGADDLDIAREAARLLDKVLKGAKAGDLPVERPTRLEFAINLKTARLIGLDIPPMAIARADRVIE
ncbi:MAG: ABC transporter substrate-binding protein [Alphaproteobacteria bacterium]|nr:ABC transporter substrate-binding protein [Alphaproteobacteria bacterium]MCW5740641.1 ABC transporter substrate-binding protein [Alphaproteobacteria bacterium]